MRCSMRAHERSPARTGGARQPIREPCLVEAQTLAARVSLRHSTVTAHTRAPRASIRVHSYRQHNNQENMHGQIDAFQGGGRGSGMRDERRAVRGDDRSDDACDDARSDGSDRARRRLRDDALSDHPRARAHGHRQVRGRARVLVRHPGRPAAAWRDRLRREPVGLPER
ncbi:hypothetical protein EMIT0111MI5_10924 [Burkholderia sp. IT-111MI5]